MDAEVAAEQGHASNPGQLTVTVSYNGLDQEVRYNPHAQVRAIYEHALHEFGIPPNMQGLGLFTEAGVQLSLDSSAEAAGIQPGARLQLRARAVSGGSL